MNCRRGAHGCECQASSSRGCDRDAQTHLLRQASQPLHRLDATWQVDFQAEDARAEGLGPVCMRPQRLAQHVQALNHRVRGSHHMCGRSLHLTHGRQGGRHVPGVLQLWSSACTGARLTLLHPPHGGLGRLTRSLATAAAGGGQHARRRPDSQLPPSSWTWARCRSTQPPSARSPGACAV